MPLSRRDFVTGSLAFGTAVSTLPFAVGSTTAPRARRLRIAHLTDLHIQPELEATRGVAACFAHVQSLPERLGYDGPDLIVTGGDTIMDGFEADKARTTIQWDLWRKTKADHCSLEVHSVVGNHDVWGWAKAKAGATGEEPLYGKQWACAEFGRDKPYTSFDRGGWHIVLLDSTFPFQESYIGKLDEPQWDWLVADLAAVEPTTPVIIFSHIPIHSATALAVAGPTGRQGSAINVPGGVIHVDGDRLLKLFVERRNVKACVSGHMHLVEQLDFQGVRHLCNGAVSAGWWKGLHRGTDFGYALVDLFDDGTVECHYVPYGWTAAT